MTKSRWTWCINYRAMEILFDVSVVEVEMGFPFHEGISTLHESPLTFDLPHLRHRFQHGHCQWPSIDASHCSDTAVIRYNAGRYLLQIHHLQIRPWIFTLKKRRSCSKFLLKCPVWRSQNWLLWECEITTRLLPCRIVTMAQANGLWSELNWNLISSTTWYTLED